MQIKKLNPVVRHHIRLTSSVYLNRT
jgi:hypothetical protein